MTAPTLAVDDLSVSYGPRSAITGLTFQVEPGEVLALAGPNGSGKSTLLRTLVGLERARGGTIRVAGTFVAQLPFAARARRVSWMPQEEPLGDNLPVEEYAAYGRHPYRGSFGPETDADRAAVRSALELVGAAEFVGRRIHDLSGGERQRVRLARVLAQEAPLVLLDEPTAHLDIGHQIDLLARLRDLARDRRTCLLIALHDLNLAARFADRLLVLSRGRRMAFGTPRQVLSAALLAEVWGIDAELRRDPGTDQPYLIPRLPAAATPVPAPVPADARRHIHVLAGGGSARDLLPALVQAGFAVSVGPVPLFDSDHEVAEELHLPSVVELPFSRFSDETLRRARQLMATADAVVVAPYPVGPGNLATLEELGEVARTQRVIFVRQPPGREWDFTGGRAAELRRSLITAHPEEPDDAGALVTALLRLAPTLRGVGTAPIATERISERGADAETVRRPTGPR